MVSSDYAQYKPLFVQTAWDYMREMEHGMELLRSDASNQHVLEIMHISAHSLKGQSLVMGFAEFGETAHSLEKLFAGIKDGKDILTGEELLQVSGVIESMKQVLTQISAEDKEADMSGEKHIIEELIRKRGSDI